MGVCVCGRPGSEQPGRRKSQPPQRLLQKPVGVHLKAVSGSAASDSQCRCGTRSHREACQRVNDCPWDLSAPVAAFAIVVPACDIAFVRRLCVPPAFYFRSQSVPFRKLLPHMGQCPRLNHVFPFALTTGKRVSGFLGYLQWSLVFCESFVTFGYKIRL